MSAGRDFHQPKCSIRLIDFDKLLTAEIEKLRASISRHHALALATAREDSERNFQGKELTEAVKVNDQAPPRLSDQLTSQALRTIAFEAGGVVQGSDHTAPPVNDATGGLSPSLEFELNEVRQPMRSKSNSGLSNTRISKKMWTQSLEDVSEVDDVTLPIQTSVKNGRVTKSAFSKQSSRLGTTSLSSNKSVKWLSLGDSIELSQVSKKVSRQSTGYEASVVNESDESGVTSKKLLDWIYQKRLRTAAFLRHPVTEIFIAFTIMSNCVVVGLEVDWSVNNPEEVEMPVGFSVFGYAFSILFATEVALRMFVLLSRFFTGSDSGWNIFDLTLVIASAVEVVIEVLYRTGSDNFSNLRIVRMVRIARILRIIRVARIVRLLVALRLLCAQILSTLRSVFWAMLLLVMILYTFGMLFAQAASAHLAEHKSTRIEDRLKSHNDIEEYWSTVPRSMYTLYKTITGGVDWENVTLALSDIHWFWVCTFIVFLSFTIFAVLNTVVGVFCQSAIQTAQSDHENSVRLKVREKQMFIRKIRGLFAEIDKSGDGEITYDEFLSHLHDEQVVAYFQILDVDPTDTADLFSLMDNTGDHAVDVEEFIAGCLRLRGPAKAMDVAKVMNQNKFIRKQLTTLISQLQLNQGTLTPTHLES